MALVQLTQANKDTLKSDPNFKSFLVNQVRAKAENYLGLADFPSQQQALNLGYARAIRTNLDIVASDAHILDFMLIQMAVRGLAQYDNAAQGTITDQTIAYLSGAGTPVGFIVDDYFIEKTKNN
jgi:hypothetical protein